MLKDMLVAFKLFFFCRHFISVHIQELSSEKTDSISSVFQHLMHIFRLSDIPCNFDPLSGSGHRFDIDQFFQFFLFLVVGFLKCHILCYRIMVRIDDDCSFDTVNDQNVTVIYHFRDIFQSNDSRNFKCSCHDGAVGSPSAYIGQKCDDLASVQLCCI